MIVRFIFQAVAFGFLYGVAMMVTFPFLVYFGKPQPWQKAIEFMMSFPIDNEKVGAFSFFGVVGVFFLNGLLWGLVLIGIFRVGILINNLFAQQIP